MTRLAARQSTTCPPRTSWYVCTAGPFRGCCSVDPCTEGICPDENSNLLSPTVGGEAATNTAGVIMVTATATVSSTASTTVSTAASTTRKTEPTTTTDRNMLTPTSSATTPTSATSSETPESTSATTDDPNPSHRQSNAGMIGGIVGGVVAMLIIGLIVYLVYRKKKRRGKRFTLVRWRYGPRMDDGQVTTAGNEPTSTAQPEPQPQSSSTIASSTVTGPPNIQLPIIPEGQSLALSPYLVSSPDSQTDSRRTIPSASSASPNTLFSSSSKSTPNTNYPTLAIPLHPESIHPALRQQQTHLPTAHSTPPNPTPSSTSPSIPNPHESTPELFDTGFYRGRLELPENSSRELINIPLTAKLKERQQKQLAGSPGPIITPDGAILTANFNNQPVHPGLHAMSFMNFDSGFDSSGDSRFEACWSRCRRGSGEKAKERTRRGS